MKKTLTMGIVLVLLLACVGAVSANLVLNGGFEKPAVNGAGWDIFQSGTSGLDWNVVWANNAASFGGLDIPVIANAELQKEPLLGFDAYEGSQYAELDTDWDGPSGGVSGEPANVTMSQPIVTTAGKHYTITWEQRRRAEDGHNPSELAFSWNGDGPVVTTGVVGAWTKYTYDRVANGPSTTISFTGVQEADSLGALIDDVSVVEVPDEIPVPEFPTMALPAALIVGLIGAVLFIQKSKED
jgi:hypothetical protein